MTYASDILDVEISIVNHGNREVTQACLQSLEAACRGLDWHATVVDNASDDGVADLISDEFPRVAVICNTTRFGFGQNQNQVIVPAVESDGVRYVLVLNNDTELAAGSVSALVEYADHHTRLGAVGPRTYNLDGTEQPSTFRFPTLIGAVVSAVLPRAPALGCREADGGRLWLGGACLLLRAKALRDVGVFDQRFFLFFEDIDLAHRLWAGGWTLAMCPESSMMHHNHKTVERDELRFVMACQLRRSHYLYLAKYHGRASARCLARLGRLFLMVRARVERVSARIRRSEAAAERAAFLDGLGRYDPRMPLFHELCG